jgi:hypothetical protein
VTHDRERDLANAAALGNALLAFLVVPWTLTLLLYSGGWWVGVGNRRTHAAVIGGACVQQLRTAAGSSRQRGISRCCAALQCKPAIVEMAIKLPICPNPRAASGLHLTYKTDKAVALRQQRHVLR